jgi:prepilin-type N-terminal cleavage/methylation domain-containing protein
MYITNMAKQKGFTLIELLVSIALFSIVMTIALGAIITIADSNKKARSLMSVMNNLNFAVDNISRSFSTGFIQGTNNNSNNCFSTNEVIYSGAFGSTREVEYCWDENEKTLTKDVDGSAVPITSPDVIIEYAEFRIFGESTGEQPLLVIVLEGEVKITDEIRSKFTINTSVAQRKLNI